MADPSREVWIRRGAAILAAVLVAALAYILISGRDGDDSESKEVVAADATEIRNLAEEQGHVVYWAGPAAAETFEWSVVPDGRIYVRYLKGNVEIEDPRPIFLTVGTYPVGNGVAAVRQAAKSPRSRSFEVRGGGIGFVNKDNPTSVYLAYPGSAYQIEVFDPNPARALRLVRAGRIQPVH